MPEICSIIAPVYRNTDCSSIGKAISKLPILLDMQTLGDRVRLARNELGWSQKRLAKAAKIGQSSIAELESGDSKESAAIVRIAYALGVTPQWLEWGKLPKKLDEVDKVFHELEPPEQRVILETIRATIASKKA